MFLFYCIGISLTAVQKTTSLNELNVLFFWEAAQTAKQKIWWERDYLSNTLTTVISKYLCWTEIAFMCLGTKYLLDESKIYLEEWMRSLRHASEVECRKLRYEKHMNYMYLKSFLHLLATWRTDCTTDISDVVQYFSCDW